MFQTYCSLTALFQTIHMSQRTGSPVASRTYDLFDPTGWSPVGPLSLAVIGDCRTVSVKGIAAFSSRPWKLTVSFTRYVAPGVVLLRKSGEGQKSSCFQRKGSGPSSGQSSEDHSYCTSCAAETKDQKQRIPAKRCCLQGDAQGSTSLHGLPYLSGKCRKSSSMQVIVLRCKYHLFYETRPTLRAI